MNLDENWIIVGKFGRVHGLKGLIKVNSYTELRDSILDYQPWYMLFQDHWQPIKLLESRAQDKQLLVQVDRFSERDQASQLTNVLIAVPKNKLPSLSADEYYWHELIGLNVIDRDGEALGIVKDIFATGSNDVLVVEGERQLLIPYLMHDIILRISKAENIMQVEWDKNF